MTEKTDSSELNIESGTSFSKAPEVKIGVQNQKTGFTIIISNKKIEGQGRDVNKKEDLEQYSQKSIKVESIKYRF